jgi:glutaconate CoA-transferase, subunit A
MAEIMTAREAVERYIKTGTQVCWGGFSYTRRPYTIAREVIRQRDRIQHTFATMNGGASIEEALAANDLISRLETTYIGLEGIQPVAYSIRRRIQDGSIPLFEDYSNYGYATRTIAGRFGWPFAPLMAELGSDVPEYDVFGKAGLRGKNADGSWIDPRIPPKKFAVIDDPFDGWGLRPHAFEGGDTTANKTNALDRIRESDKYTGNKGVKVMLVPPLLPEVTVIRSQRVAIDGTVRMEGILGPDAEQAMCAKTLIVECEQIVPSDELRAAPELNHLPAHITTAIVEQPFGGYPSAVPNYYDYDWDWWVSYGRLNRKSKEEVKDWWTRHVVDTKDDWDYLQRIVGMNRLFELRATPAYGYRADLKRPM